MLGAKNNADIVVVVIYFSKCYAPKGTQPARAYKTPQNITNNNKSIMTGKKQI